ncbi:MAG: hypothetical protein Q8K79_01790 [Solirubrobacteraceae bacterium]|nr:hypothetical protein [Solirubrobacteraceae bacterium]
MPTTSTVRRRPRTTLALVAVVVLAPAATGLGLRGSASAQAPGATTLTFTELDRGSMFKHIRNTKTKNRRSNLMGDLIVFTSPLADSAGRRVGRIHVGCVTTVGSSNFEKSNATCSGSMVTAQGTLTLQAMTSPGVARTVGAVTGGTGAYANARGTFTSVEGRNGDSADTITLVP